MCVCVCLTYDPFDSSSFGYPRVVKQFDPENSLCSKLIFEAPTNGKVYVGIRPFGDSHPIFRVQLPWKNSTSGRGHRV